MSNIPVATVVGVMDAPAVASAPPSFAPVALPPSAVQNDGGAMEFLTANHWPVPMQEVFLQGVSKIPRRFFICDDSGSMEGDDGKRIVVANGKSRFIKCSRWAELTAALRFHAELAHQGLIPSEFRLLNSGQAYKIGFSAEESSRNLHELKDLLNGSPNGGTPLCHHIREVTAQIRAMEPQLRASGQKACVVIATDGESSDGDVAEALKPLKDLPAWVVVRLCTDSDRVVEYWNNIDSVLEHNLDILDDLAGEADEVYTVNPWLTYAEPLHRLREFGMSMKELDVLDESRLSLEQMRKVCKMLYGRTVDSLPDPAVDLKAFVTGINNANVSSARVWNPAKQKMRNWVDAQVLARSYGGGGCAIL